MLSAPTSLKRIGVAIAAGFCALVTGISLFGAPQPAHADDQTSTIAMHRLYNPNSGEHFYTAKIAERTNLINVGWMYEGTGWLAPSTTSNPVYRLYSGTDHHYTMDLGERNGLMRQGWKFEGIGWYSADPSTGEPLYRQYNPNVNPSAPTGNAGSHNYTTSKAENNALVAGGWKGEGIGWYALPNNSTIENDGSNVSVETDMNLRGTGSGYHAKVDISSVAGNAVASFGIQYEKDMRHKYPQFANNTCFLVENVMSHATVAGPQGKEYLYVSPASLGTTVKVRISWFKADNTLRFYVDGREISRTSATFEDGTFIVAVEGSVAHNGDTINATFNNTKAKGKGRIYDVNDRGTQYFVWWSPHNYFGLTGSLSVNNSTGLPSMTVTGRANIPGINPATGTPWDWDTCFSAVEPNTGTKNNPLSGVVNAAIL